MGKRYKINAIRVNVIIFPASVNDIENTAWCPTHWFMYPSALAMEKYKKYLTR